MEQCYRVNAKLVDEFMAYLPDGPFQDDVAERRNPHIQEALRAASLYARDLVHMDPCEEEFRRLVEWARSVEGGEIRAAREELVEVFAKTRCYVLDDHIYVTEDIALTYSSIDELPGFVSYGAQLTLFACRKMESLPASITVFRGITLTHCPKLVDIGCTTGELETVRIDGCCCITGIPDTWNTRSAVVTIMANAVFASFPKNFACKRLDVRDCASIETIDECKCAENITITGCMNLAKVGKISATVLRLENCHSLHSLPVSTVDITRVHIDKCDAFSRVPTRCRDLEVVNCNGPIKFPEAFRGGDVSIRLCKGLEEIPKDFSSAKFHMEDCHSIDMIYGHCAINFIKVVRCNRFAEIRDTGASMIEITLCDQFKTLPEVFEGKKTLAIKRSHGIATLPRVCYCVRVMEANSIVSLPEKDAKYSFLTLANCKHLKSLGENTVVDEQTVLVGCPSLEDMPHSLRACKKLIVEDCVSIHSQGVVPDGPRVFSGAVAR